MKWLFGLFAGGSAAWWCAGLAAAAALALAGMVWIERGRADAQRERAVRAEDATVAALAAAAANARAAEWQRAAAEAAQTLIAELDKARGEVTARVETVIREIRRESDAYRPVGPALRRTAQRLRELDAATRPAARPDDAGPALSPAGDPGPATPAR